LVTPRVFIKSIVFIKMFSLGYLLRSGACLPKMQCARSKECGVEFVHHVSNEATIRDIARLAGVSTKTGSLVVNRHPGVSPHTRQAVNGVIAALSYRPNAHARSLAGKRSYILGLLFDGASGNYFVDLEAGALTTCREEGYHLILDCVSTQDNDLLTKVSAFIATTKARGLILTPPLCDSETLLDELARRNLPTVRIAPGRHDQRSFAIGIDDYRAAYKMTRYLLDLGHRYIAFIKGKPDHSSAMARLAGFRAALADAKGPIVRSVCEQGDFSYQGGWEAAARLYSRNPRPTAVFAGNDDMAAGALAACQKFMLRVPDDVSIAGFDDSGIAQVVWPQLTTCRQPVKAMGAAAVSVVIYPQKRKKAIWQFECELVVRQSTAPPGTGTLERTGATIC
jgi:LacI family transcriptional regulator